METAYLTICHQGQGYRMYDFLYATSLYAFCLYQAL